MIFTAITVLYLNQLFAKFESRTSHSCGDIQFLVRRPIGMAVQDGGRQTKKIQ